MSKTSFIEACLAGNALLSDIDDWIERWHESPSSEVRSLSAWLGMSPDEYAAWLADPDSLNIIVAARKEHVALCDVIDSDANELCFARAENPEVARKLREWLKKTNRI